jgi:hypothetical protein
MSPAGGRRRSRGRASWIDPFEDAARLLIQRTQKGAMSRNHHFLKLIKTLLGNKGSQRRTGQKYHLMNDLTAPEALVETIFIGQ